MNRTVIELDTLTDTDRAGTKYHDLLLVSCLLNLVASIKAAIIIRCLRCKLGRTGINHLKCCGNAILITELLDLFLGLSGPACDHVVRKFHSLRFLHEFLVDIAATCLELLLHLNKDRKLINEPLVNLCNLMDLVVGCETTTENLSNQIDTAVIHDIQLLKYILIGHAIIITGLQTVYMLCQRTDCFHQTTLEVCTDTHNLTGCFHLCGQCTLRIDKLIKRKSRNLYNTVVQCRLKACVSLSGNGIRDLIQSIAKRDLRCHLGDRITGCL